MKNMGALGLLSLVLSICVADSASIIPTAILLAISFVLIMGSRLCAR